MADFPSSVKTFSTLVDLIDSVLAEHQNERGGEITALEAFLSAAELRAGWAAGVVMSGTVTLTDDDVAIQRFACDGANRIVKLPAFGEENHLFLIMNVSGSAYTLTVQSNGGTALVALLDGDYVLMLPNGGDGWVPVRGTETIVACAAHQTSAQTGIVSGTNTVITYDAEDKDLHGIFTPSTGKIQPSGAHLGGTYTITATVAINSIADGKLLWIGMQKNGDASKLYWGTAQGVGAASSPTVSMTKDFYLNGSSDYVQVIGWHNHGSNRDTAPGSASLGWNCYFQARRISKDDLAGF